MNEIALPCTFVRYRGIFTHVDRLDIYDDNCHTFNFMFSLEIVLKP